MAKTETEKKDTKEILLRQEETPHHQDANYGKYQRENSYGKQKLPGGIHDYNIFKRENTAKQLPPKTAHYGDSGYDGATNDYPEHTIILPVKKRRNHSSLSLSEKRFNRKHSRIRILVEHVLSRMKKYRILAQVYRHKIIDYNRRFKNVAALINFRLASPAI